MEKLYDYCNVHPVITEFCKSINLKNILNNKYSELSQKIHGKTIKNKEFTESLSKLVFEKRLLINYLELVIFLVQVYNMLLMIFNADTFRKMDSTEKQFILNLLSKENFKIYRKHRLV